MELDPKALKEINTAVDGFIKKNKDSVQNTKLIMKLQKRVADLEKRLDKTMEYAVGINDEIHDSVYKNLQVAAMKIEKLERNSKK